MLRFEGSFRFDVDAEDDYALLLKSLATGDALSQTAIVFYEEVLCNSRRRKHVLATHRDPTTREVTAQCTGDAVGVVGTMAEARRRNDAHHRDADDIDPIYLFAPERFTDLHPVHDSTTFLGAFG